MKTWDKPIAGVDYPRNMQEFDSWFTDEAACRAFLIRVRWPAGFVCACCQSRQSPWVTSRGYMHCRACGSELSITAGTIFERSRKPLRLWFQAMWLVTSQKHGANALGLQRVLGLGSYQTAWTWLHKLRHAMVRPDRERLHGSIEVDETYIGSEGEVKRGKGAENKEIVVIAVELLSPKGFGRVRMRCVPDVSSKSLMSFICDVAEPGSEIRTDGWTGYLDVTKHGYSHKRTVISAGEDPAHVAMPGVHRVAGLLKRWLLGIHQGAVSAKHLEYYLDEFTFRFNRRKSAARGMLFYRLMQQAVATSPMPYEKIVGRDHQI